MVYVSSARIFILKEDFVHICMFERYFFGEEPLNGSHSVSHFQEYFTALKWPRQQHPGLQKLSSLPKTGLRTFPFLLFCFRGVTQHICKMDQKYVDVGRQ